MVVPKIVRGRPQTHIYSELTPMLWLAVNFRSFARQRRNYSTLCLLVDAGAVFTDAGVPEVLTPTRKDSG